MKTCGASLALVLLCAIPARADALKAAVVGCNTPADAQKIAVLVAKHDKAGADALARPLVASRACIDLAKGVKIDIDERKPPMACVRLTGDLSCYWIVAAAVDEHPGETGGGSPRKAGGRHH